MDKLVGPEEIKNRRVVERLNKLALHLKSLVNVESSFMDEEAQVMVTELQVTADRLISKYTNKNLGLKIDTVAPDQRIAKLMKLPQNVVTRLLKLVEEENDAFKRLDRIGNDLEQARDILIEARNNCLSVSNYDTDGAILLSQTIKWLNCKMEGKIFKWD